MTERQDLNLVQAQEPSEQNEQTASLQDAEIRSLENDRLSLENKHLQEKIENLKQDRKQRKKYGKRLFGLVACWLSVLGLIVFLHGLSHVPFELSVTVLTTLIGSTTVSVLGLFVIVANYLFPKRDSKGTHDREA